MKKRFLNILKWRLGAGLLAVVIFIAAARPGAARAGVQDPENCVCILKENVVCGWNGQNYEGMTIQCGTNNQE